jgi:glycosyltransferase involved in cell wall biosynthesis
VAIITPTLPGREHLLEQAKESVSAQTIPVTHHTVPDAKRDGPQQVRNWLVAGTSDVWILPLDDDDTLDPECVETLLANSEGADIVYSFCRMDGRDDWCPNRLFNSRTLMRRNFIPVTALIRKDLWDLLGGQRKVPMEDHDFYKRAWLHGARFKCVPEVLWSYRFHDSNQFQGVRAA